MSSHVGTLRGAQTSLYRIGIALARFVKVVLKKCIDLNLNMLNEVFRGEFVFGFNVHTGLLALGWLVGINVWASVHHIPTISDVDYRGRSEKAGSITFLVDGDDFFLATPDTPVYIRIRLKSGVTLSKTLVAPTANITLHQPYYLAAFVTGAPSLTINMPPDAIAIARWVAGEKEFWLRVTTPTEDWINDGGILQSPDWDKHVIFRLGISGNESADEMAALYAVGKANRPFNSNFFGEPANTEIWVDASASILGIYPDPSGTLKFNPFSADWQTTGVETAQHSTQIITGDASGVDFTGAYIIAHAYVLGRSVPMLDFQGLVGMVVLLLAVALFVMTRTRDKNAHAG
ncbi:MAG: hypothetical protein H6510_14470 [Acidobacteria bacterium]|nr:hypothetical protein [Acidobacteriota bacterium]MCB9399015.1 hypothetical protein [Acidobacteriota bacterium]